MSTYKMLVSNKFFSSNKNENIIVVTSFQCLLLLAAMEYEILSHNFFLCVWAVTIFAFKMVVANYEMNSEISFDFN